MRSKIQTAFGPAILLVILIFVEQVFAMSDVLVTLRALEPRADLLARAGCADHREPVARRSARRFARHDLDDVS